MPAELITVADLTGQPGGLGDVAVELGRLLAARVRTLPAEASAEAVMAVLDAKDARLCVLPSGGGSGEARGWVVAAGSGKPVVLVPRGARLRHPQVERVLLPLDGSEEAADAIGTTVDVLYRAGVELVVLHVFDPTTVPRFWDQRAHAHEAWSREFTSRSAPPGARVELRRGRPSAQVLDAARDEDVDLIAFGWSGTVEEGRARTVRESVALAPVPVVLLPSDGRRRRRASSSTPHTTTGNGNTISTWNGESDAVANTG